MICFFFFFAPSGGTAGTAARAARAAGFHGSPGIVPWDPGVGSPRDLGVRTPMGFRGIPLAEPKDSRFPGRLTRDSQVVSLEIPRFLVHLFIKNSGKIVKISLSDSRDQNKILKF